MKLSPSCGPNTGIGKTPEGDPQVFIRTARDKPSRLGHLHADPMLGLQVRSATVKQMKADS